jgi:hypothetical protein
MNTKQRVATGFLALVIVGSVALMPVSAGDKNAPVAASQSRAETTTVATRNTSELPQEQVRDLTYN